MKKEKIKEKIKKKIEKLYPPVFFEEIEYGKGIIKYGKQEQTEIRRLSLQEERVLLDVLEIIENL